LKERSTRFRETKPPMEPVSLPARDDHEELKHVPGFSKPSR
jgi:hypothetical protein